MAAALRLAAVVATLLGLAQGARVAKRRHHRKTDDIIRVVQGGAMTSAAKDTSGMDAFRNLPPKAVKYISAADTSYDAKEYQEKFLKDFGVNEPEWIPLDGSNCNEMTRDPKYVQMVEEAAAIYIGGGQSGRISSCLFGNYSRSGINGGEETPLLKALRATPIVGGSSAGAMTQPSSEIIITGRSKESYYALRDGEVYQRDAGNGFIGSPQAVDTHFSERGRQGRLLVFAMQTKAQWAFGVDESTAYIWRPSGVYEVTCCENGLVIFEGASGTKASQSARMHYLSSGDSIDTNDGTITYSADKSPCSGAAPRGSKSVFNARGANVYKDISIATAQAPVGTTVNNYHGSSRAVQVDFTKDDRTVAMCGPSGKSFGNLLVEQYSSSKRVLAFSELEKPNIPEDYIYPSDE